MGRSYRFLLLLSLCACTSGHAASIAPRTGPSQAPYLGPKVTASLSITIPPRKRSADKRAPKYVSPATLSIAIQVTPASSTASAPPSATATFNVTPGQTTYTQTLQVPTGSDVFTISLYDQANGAGNLLARGSQTQTMAAGANNQVQLALAGVISQVFANTVPLSAGQIQISPLAFDADGNVISGTYTSPVTFTDLDTSGHTSFSSGGTLATVTASSANVTLVWDLSGSFAGGPCQDITVRTSGGGFTYNAPIALANKVVINGNPSGAGSLHDALTVSPGNDTIIFAPSAYTSGSTIVPIAISSTINISGTGNTVNLCGPLQNPPIVTLDGGTSAQILQVGNETLTIRDLRFQNAGASGAIHTTSLSGAYVTLVGDSFVNNQSYGNAGAVLNGSGNTLYVYYCYFKNNFAGDGNGGAIDDYGPLTVVQSTFEKNQAQYWGGGAIAVESGASATITNSTFFQNGSIISIYGGGAVQVLSGGTASIDSVTFSGNAVSGGGDGGSVGGSVSGSIGSVTIANSILNGGTPHDLDANAFTFAGYNMLGSQGSATIKGTGVLVAGSPNLGTYGDHGGPTFTVNLLAGSPAIDAIPSGSCTQTLDQRGVSRPQGSGCDIGAYEYP